MLTTHADVGDESLRVVQVVNIKIEGLSKCCRWLTCEVMRASSVLAVLRFRGSFWRIRQKRLKTMHRMSTYTQTSYLTLLHFYYATCMYVYTNALSNSPERSSETQHSQHRTRTHHLTSKPATALTQAFNFYIYDLYHTQALITNVCMGRQHHLFPWNFYVT